MEHPGGLTAPLTLLPLEAGPGGWGQLEAGEGWRLEASPGGWGRLEAGEGWMGVWRRLRNSFSLAPSDGKAQGTWRMGKQFLLCHSSHQDWGWGG